MGFVNRYWFLNRKFYRPYHLYNKSISGKAARAGTQNSNLELYKRKYVAVANTL